MERNYLITLLDGYDLTRIHTIACFLGVCLCVFFMQTMTQAKLTVPGDTAASYWVRRFGLLVLAIALCWAGIYSSAKGWMPWPPDVALVLVVDLLLGLNIWVARRTARSSGVMLADAVLAPVLPPAPR